MKEGADKAAYKAGRAAHDIAQETKEAAKKAGKAISQGAHEAREGWKDAERDDRSRSK